MNLFREIESFRYKNIKLFYYIKGLFRLYCVPDFLCRKLLKANLAEIKKYNEKEIWDRVNYYNKLSKPANISKNAIAIKNFKFKDFQSAYFLDTYQYLRFFDKSLKVHLLFGDITYVPKVPSIVKSRPINADNANSVLLNLDKFRHFNFIHDRKSFHEKKDELVWRGHISLEKPARIQFLKKYYDHPKYNVGYTNNWNQHPEWRKEKMTIPQQLEYKFILCLEGVDVATNLKWVMSSNSLAVMPKPRFETWFMEGKLIPNYHYVLIKDDFSDLEEKIDYYSKNQNEALKIIDNAHRYIEQFKDKKKEKLISLLVLQKYFSDLMHFMQKDN